MADGNSQSKPVPPGLPPGDGAPRPVVRAEPRLAGPKAHFLPGGDQSWLLVGKLRFFARLWAVPVLGLAWFFGGWFSGAGAFLGAFLVELNLGLLIRALKRAGADRRKNLTGVLVKFYLAFLVTALCCFVAVKYRLGHPLAFLAGLSTFFFGLVLALMALAARRGFGDDPQA